MPFGLLFTWALFPKLEITFYQKFFYSTGAVKLHALHLTTFLMAFATKAQRIAIMADFSMPT